mgnify:CR=1 FL=1
MWLLAINGLVYVIYGLASGHFVRKLLPLAPLAVFRDLALAIRLKRLTAASSQTW